MWFLFNFWLGLPVWSYLLCGPLETSETEVLCVHRIVTGCVALSKKVTETCWFFFSLPNSEISAIWGSFLKSDLYSSSTGAFYVLNVFLLEEVLGFLSLEIRLKFNTYKCTGVAREELNTAMPLTWHACLYQGSVILSYFLVLVCRSGTRRVRTVIHKQM